MWQVDPTLDLLSKAVDVAAFRQAVHAANVANADVPGYQPLEVRFAPETSESTVAGFSSAQRLEEAAEQIPELAASAQGHVHLDEEMAQMAQNALRYQLLLGAFERTVGLLRYAAREGKEG
ncbi:MAG TPA: flagellar basal body protein [Steroidobacteraceae bacterium]